MRVIAHMSIIIGWRMRTKVEEEVEYGSEKRNLTLVTR